MPFFLLGTTGGGNGFGVLGGMSCFGDQGFLLKKRTSLATKCNISIECLTSIGQVNDAPLSTH